MSDMKVSDLTMFTPMVRLLRTKNVAVDNRKLLYYYQVQYSIV